MTNTDDIRLQVQTAEGTVVVLIERSAVRKLSGRTHLTPEETVVAQRMEIEDIVRDRMALGPFRGTVRLTESDF